MTGTPRQSRASPRPQACGRLLLSFPVGNDALVAQELSVRIADTPEMQNTSVSSSKATAATSNAVMPCGEGNVLELELTVRCRQPIIQDEGLDLIARNPGILRISI